MILALTLGLLGLAFGGFAGYLFAKRDLERRAAEAGRTAESIVAQAKEDAKRIVEEAELKAKERLASAEEQARKMRRELERQRRELKDQAYELEKKAKELKDQERRLTDKDKILRQKERALSARERKLAERENEVVQRLEQIARMTRDEAREVLLKQIESQVRYEAAQMAYKIKEEARAKAEREAKEIITTAIQRCAASHTAETTVTVVSLPSDDIKGRIIGREGRNIRAFEAATGVEVIIDDTPEAVILSSFDPVRREIAKIAMEALVRDGRIHPARIEEVVEKARAEFDERVREIGRQVIVDLGITDMKPELVEYVGRLKFRSSYGQNLLQHSVEVAKLAALMAAELGLDVEKAKRAGLLHDIGKLVPDVEMPHALIGAQIAKRHGEDEVVVNAIAAHHEDVDPLSPIAVIVAAADAISGARPGARRETLEAYLKRIEKLEEIASAYPGVEAAYAMQAGREVRVIVQADRVSDAQAMEMARQIAQEIEENLEYPGQIRVVVIRETRAIQYAK
ncbi:ribonuclease Y [Candidatus Bathyarchaeota archaeon]|nr:MAG: ribonuclease Y [Candidatus Bathyarchaeota archaeon]